jgi:hypothetical protein
MVLWLTGGRREGWRRERGTWRCRGCPHRRRAAVKWLGDGGKAEASEGVRWG